MDGFDFSDTLKIKLDYFGPEEEPILTASDVFKNPDSARAFAIERSNRFQPSMTSYPGVILKVPASYVSQLLKNFSSKIVEVFNRDNLRLSFAASSFSIVCTPEDKLTPLQKTPHFDSQSPLSFAFVHYLSNHKNTGIDFYQHQQTNFQFVDRVRSSKYLNHAKDELHITKEFGNEGYPDKSTPCYKQVHTEMAKPNKIVGYRGCALHSGRIPADMPLEKDPSLGRLTITTFFEFN